MQTFQFPPDQDFQSKIPCPRSEGPSNSTTMRPHRTRRPSYKLRENGKPVHNPRQPVPGSRQRRATRVEVLVPTLRQVDRLRNRNGNGDTGRTTRGEQSRSTPPLKTEEQEVKFHFLLKARIKSEVKREDISFENVVRDRLARMGPETIYLDVPQPLLEATATRIFMARTWGGRPGDMFPQISKNFTHGLDDFMYINSKYDPHVPLWPGAPGLFFRFGEHDEEGWPKIKRVVVRVESHAWQYMGQYAVMAAPPLTHDEWSAQSHQAKRSWATQFSKGNTTTSQQIAALVRSKGKFEVSPDDIVKECNEGNVVVRVWYMKCVDYDVNFQRRIAAGSRNLRAQV